MTRLTTTLLLLVLAAGLTLVGCGGGGGSGPEAGGNLEQPLDVQASANPPPGARASGSMAIQTRLLVPENERAGVLLKRPEFEAANVLLLFQDLSVLARPNRQVNFEVADDGSSITFGPIAAAGWTITAGENGAILDQDGKYELEIPEGVSQAFIFTPFDRSRPVVVIPTEELTGELLFVHDFAGPCGPVPMTPDFCGPTALAAAPSNEEPDPEKFLGKIEAEGISRQLSLHFIEGGLGTYPDGDERTCQQIDGPSSRFDIVNSTTQRYFGSTCHQLVMQGCCNGEGGSFFGFIRNRAIGNRFPTQFTPPSIPCYLNHKGRYCQEVLPGDLTVQAKGHICGALNQRFSCPDIEVQPGESVLVLVHNNGCYGKTIMGQSRREIGGQLTFLLDAHDVRDPSQESPPDQQAFEPLPTNKTESSHPEVSGAITHFNRDLFNAVSAEQGRSGKLNFNNNIYIPERRLTYSVPADAQGPARDTFFFKDDGVTISVTFFLPASPPPPPTPTPTPTPTQTPGVTPDPTPTPPGTGSTPPTTPTPTPTPPTTPPETFTSSGPQQITADPGAQSFAIADLDRDFLIDVLTINGSSISLQPGRGAGFFLPPTNTNLSTGNGTQVSTGDVNGNGNDDVIVIHADGTLEVLSNSFGVFSGPSIFSGATNPTGVGLFDLDGNGSMDIITSGDEGLIFSPNTDGNGTFSQAVTLSLPGNVPATGFEFGSFTGGAQVDIVTTNQGGGLSTFVHQGGNTFARTDSLPGLDAIDFAVGDLNSDPFPDLIVNTQQGVHTLISDGLGGFSESNFFSFPGLEHIQVADMNNDGDPDLVGTSGTSISIIASDGSGVFDANNPTMMTTNGNILDLLLIDVDQGGSNLPDVVVLTDNNGSRQVQSFTNTSP